MDDLQYPFPSLLERVLDIFRPSHLEKAKMWWESLQRIAAPSGTCKISKALWDNLFAAPGQTRIHGPDVSSHQSMVDWSEIRASGASFAFAKATEGVGWKDPRFDENWAGMAEVGLVRGAYHFARVSIKDKSASKAERLEQVRQDAHAEAQWFTKVVYGEGNPVAGDLPLVLDIEWDKRAEGIKVSEIVAFCKAFSEEIFAKTGRKPIIYTGPNFWRYKLGKTLDLNDHSLWLVDGYKSPAGNPKKVIPGWDWTFHQYTNAMPRPDKGRGLMDWNVFRGRQSDLAQLAGVPQNASFV